MLKTLFFPQNNLGITGFKSGFLKRTKYLIVTVFTLSSLEGHVEERRQI